MIRNIIISGGCTIVFIPISLNTNKICINVITLIQIIEPTNDKRQKDEWDNHLWFKCTARHNYINTTALGYSKSYFVRIFLIFNYVDYGASHPADFYLSLVTTRHQRYANDIDITLLIGQYFLSIMGCQWCEYYGFEKFTYSQPTKIVFSLFYSCLALFSLPQIQSSAEMTRT